MTADGFRDLAPSLPEAVEGTHRGHPDFRVVGKVFATLGWPDATWGMINLTPEVQAVSVRAESAVFRPVGGEWGRRGSTSVCLAEATEPSVRQALVAAWRNRAPERLAQRLDNG